MAGQQNGSAPPRTNGAAAPNELETLCRDLKAKVDVFLDTPTEDELLNSVKNQIIVARGVIDEALRRYRPDQLSLSYNGGKDCLVLLILILASLPSSSCLQSSSTTTNAPPSQQPPPSSSSSTTEPPPFPSKLQALYIRPTLPFAEVDEFVAETTTTYHLDLTTSGMAMKPALTAYLRQRPDVRAVFVGTRRTDPHGADLTFFDETDAGWPRFMRVHPVIDWHYREVWGFIRALDIPYCPLYDKGYTSLGGTDDTHPNPALKEEDDNDRTSKQHFRPAYELTEDREERLGRDR
ncbi:putative FAD synthetase [Hypoxylon rubiginosum]|uniref:FAD synthetase n=1 Tax=Hypoxylon rubiginosum TaxID=110542 RepID=A0ACC0CZC1_9PEZI|nr:putative FAD synthetase [Hypoxylon rubiginosum]